MYCVLQVHIMFTTLSNDLYVVLKTNNTRTYTVFIQHYNYLHGISGLLLKSDNIDIRIYI
jgi:hypothetical protein